MVHPKQDDLNKQINIKDEIPNVLYKEKEPHQMTENNRKQLKTRPANLKCLKKKFNELKFSREHSKKYCVERK